MSIRKKSRPIGGKVEVQQNEALGQANQYRNIDFYQNKNINIPLQSSFGPKQINIAKSQQQIQTVGLPMPKPFALSFVYNDKIFDLSKYQRQTNDFPDVE